MTWVTPGSSWSQSDFGDRGALDLAVGPVRGVRWWSMMDSGRLVGAFNGTWTAEENVAECRVHETFVLTTAWGAPSKYRLMPEWPVEAPRHRAAEPGCTCGFYAFWRTEPLQLYEPYPVLGVIEGYGRTVIGNRGFRCERARILGLHRPRGDYGNALDAITNLLTHQIGCSTDQRLAQRYRVPIYQSAAEMFDRHPPTTDYVSLPAVDPGADS